MIAYKMHKEPKCEKVFAVAVARFVIMVSRLIAVAGWNPSQNVTLSQEHTHSTQRTRYDNGIVLLESVCMHRIRSLVYEKKLQPSAKPQQRKSIDERGERDMQAHSQSTRRQEKRERESKLPSAVGSRLSSIRFQSECTVSAESIATTTQQKME